jgi:hypothetical protein
MLAGDSFLVVLAIIWLGIVSGKWWISAIAFAIAGTLNYIHTQIIIGQRIRSLENASKETGLPIPPFIQLQIAELKKQKGFHLWGSQLK